MAKQWQHGGTCENTDCDEPTPWDMVSIIFDQRAFCSPDCARQALESVETAPESITLHDPQFQVSRADLPAGVGEGDVDISRPVTSVDDGVAGLEAAEEMYPGTFRVALDE